MITVNSNPTNGDTLENACNVLQARNYCSLYGTDGIDNMYVTGTISELSYNSTYDNYTFVMEMIDEFGNTRGIKVFGISCSDELESSLIEGATVVINSKLMLYYDSANSGYIAEAYKGNIISIN